MGGHDSPGCRPLRRVEDRLAERRRGVGVVVEQAGVAIGEELVTFVDQEERGVTRDLGGAVRGVVHWHDQRVRAQPVVGHDLADRAERRGGDHDVGVAYGDL